jgi:predicted MFS family arabinose efflux permease
MTPTIKARSRINTIFMGGMFAGGAVGSWLAGVAWQSSGWEAVAGLASVLVVLALGVHGWARVAQSKRDGVK